MPKVQVKAPDIEADYPELHLLALSDSVVGDLASYFDRDDIFLARDSLGEFLSDRARTVYAADFNGHFRKGLKPTKRAPNRHRDQLHVWFQHWLPPELKRRKLLTGDQFAHLVNVRWSVGADFQHSTFAAYKARNARAPGDNDAG
jgi:hypothetical protein